MRRDITFRGGYFQDAAGRLIDSAGRVFDPWLWRWAPADDAAMAGAAAGAPLDALGALTLLAAAPERRRLPVGVIGPRDATDAQAATAEALGRALAGLGLTVLCGGKGGVMEACARGATQAGGLAVGLLPEDDWRGANVFIGLPIATGIGKARNVLIAQASVALVAVGGQYGTLSEVAFGLHFGKPVFGLCDAPDVPGVRRLADVEAVVAALAEHLLGPVAELS